MKLAADIRANPCPRYFREPPWPIMLKSDGPKPQAMQIQNKRNKIHKGGEKTGAHLKLFMVTHN